MISVHVFFILASALLISETVSITEQQAPTVKQQEQPEELVVNVTQANNKTITDLNDSGALRNVLLAANKFLSELPRKDDTTERRQTLRQALISELRGLRLVIMSSECKVEQTICAEARSRTAEAAVTLSKAIAEICPRKKSRIDNIVGKPCTPPDYGVLRLSNVVSITNTC